jgi:molecular chaperone GrpE
MSDDLRGQAGAWNPDETDGAESEEIEITSVEAVDVDAPPPAAGSAAGDEAAASTTGGAEAAEGESPRSGLAEPDDPAARIAALEDDLLRIRAEFENFRKRQQRDRAEFMRHASAGLMERLLPALDNFKRAMDAPEDKEAMAGFRDGISMIFRQMLDVLENEGLEPIATCGELFDPNLHEAVAREATGEVAPNTITLELEPGYRFKDRLLKPARVRVAVAPDGDS